MAINDFSAESPENFEQKCTCTLVLDVSGSMQGAAIDELNAGLQNFYDEILQDTTTADRLEIMIITFGSRVETLIEPSLVYNFKMPRLSVRGTTRLVDGVRLALKKVEERKNWYKQTGQPYYRPWVILMTDGHPDSNQDVSGLSNEIHQGAGNKKFHFFAIGVEGADMNALSKLSTPQMPPASLEGLKFSHFFKWLSASMSVITSSTDGEKINLPSATDWMRGFSV